MLLLRKCVYPYEYTNDWERFKEIASGKEKFYNNFLTTHPIEKSL